MRTAARRLWAAPIAAHLAALLIVLVAGAVFVDTHASLSEDEGAAIVQARQLSEHHTWIRPHPYPELDPQGRNYPYELSARGTKGFAPFAKHPLYALVLAGVWPLGGINALIGLSIAATVVAALIASRFALRSDPKYQRATIWAVGLGTPMFFDSYIVIAHTVGAALAASLALLLTRRSARHQLLAAAGAAALAATLVFMRTEGALFVGVVAVVALFARTTRWPGLAAGGAGVAAHFVEKGWSLAIVGKPVVIPLTARELERQQALALGGGGLRGRVDGAILTLLRPDYGTSTGSALLVVSFVALAAAVLLSRRDRRLGAVCGVLAALGALGRLAIEPAGLVPGLLIATPVVWAGLWAALSGYRDGTFRPDLRLIAALAGFAGCVIATQYARGGGVEWGGRFFALALPVVVPLAVVALAQQPKAIVRCVVAATVPLMLLAAFVLRDFHARTDELFDAIDVPAGAIPVSTAGLIPRLDWQRYDQRKWLIVPRDDTRALLDRLERAGVRRVYLLYSKGERPKGVKGTETRVAHTRWRTIDIELD